MKRITALILAILMLATLLPTTAMADSGKKLIAFTFDDGPSKNTTTLLDGLAARGAKATFFWIGSNAQNYPSVIKRAWNEGHQICNHTYSHPNLTGQSVAGIKDQLNKTANVFNNALGFKQEYYLRAPGGNYNQTVTSTAGVPCFYWSVDTRDWQSRNADSVYNMIMNYARDGSVVLLHDLYASSVQGALRAMDTLKARGYEFVTVSELFYRRGITLNNGTVYYSAYPTSYGTSAGIAEPVISTGSTEAGRVITIKGDSRGTVYYTTDGSTPTPANAQKYSGPFVLNSAATVKAVSVIKWNGIRSDTVSKTLTKAVASAPVIEVKDGCVSMTSLTAGAVIRYTSDGTVPTAASEVYSGSFEALAGTSYAARAFKDGCEPSAVSYMSIMDNGMAFKDVKKSDWYYGAVNEAVCAGLFVGTGAYEFAPAKDITRAQLVSVLYRLQDKPDVSDMAEPGFADVKSDSWYYDAVKWAWNAGIAKGTDKGLFCPEQSLTREQACCFIARYLEFIGKDLSGCEDALSGFKDAAAVSSWAKDSVNAMCALGIIHGCDGNMLQPVQSMSRAQAATVLVNLSSCMDAIPDAPEPQEQEEPSEDTPETIPEQPENII